MKRQVEANRYEHELRDSSYVNLISFCLKIAPISDILQSSRREKNQSSSLLFAHKKRVNQKNTQNLSRGFFSREKCESKRQRKSFQNANLSSRRRNVYASLFSRGAIPK